MFDKLRNLADKAKSTVTGDNIFYPEQAPAYMQIDASSMTEAYESEIIARIFSEEFTDERFSLLASTAIEPLTGWQMVDIHPHQSEDGQLGWIERYVVQGESGQNHNLGMYLSLTDRGILAAALAPGETLASPQLQIDTMSIILPLALAEGPTETTDDWQFENRLIDRGIPDIYPDKCRAKLLATFVSSPPNDTEASWSERWIYNVSDIGIGININFEQAPDGGTIIHTAGVVHQKKN